MNRKISNSSKKYFKFFEKRDLKTLENLFTNGIILIDWENKIYGKKKVLNFCQKLFLKNKIKIKIIKIFPDKKNNIASCQIQITLNNKIKINVVDIIHFNANYKIKKIQAYKG